MKPTSRGQPIRLEGKRLSEHAAVYIVFKIVKRDTRWPGVDRFFILCPRSIQAVQRLTGQPPSNKNKKKTQNWSCISAWLLFRRRRTMHIARQKVFPAKSMECALCTGGVEDFSHLFFERLFSCAVWAAEKIPLMEVT